MKRCHSCKGSIQQVIDFGQMPISNRYINDTMEEEFKFNLSIGFCDNCMLVQLIDTVPPYEMFNSNYAFFSSTSLHMSKHFKSQSDLISKICKNDPSPFVVELGSNDGIMLQHIANQGIPHLGVEPSQNVAEQSRAKGVNVTTEFFNCEMVDKIISKYGKASVICGSNVVCHIEDINSVFEGASKLLKDDGIFFFEDPYLLDIVNKTSFDQIYDEHLFYFSCLSVSKLAERFGLELIDVELLPVHGGEARYFLKKNGHAERSSRVDQQIQKELEIQLDQISGYLRFAENIKKVAYELKNKIVQLKSSGHQVIGYGATSKSATLLNFAGINSDQIDYIVDNTPSKIGKFTPGTHIPIHGYDTLASHEAKYALLLAWNHKDEIINKETEYSSMGGKFITFFPKVEVI